MLTGCALPQAARAWPPKYGGEGDYGGEGLPPAVCGGSQLQPASC
jgi:hypothetical protein